MTTRASVTSLEYYRVTITPSPDDDPTSLPVRFAFPVTGGPPITWYAAQWESGGPPYVARLLIGPAGTAELAAGAYDVYVEIEDTPEVVRFMADRLIVFSSVDLFASVAELADVMHADIDPEDPWANQALVDATALVRSYTRQTLSFVADDEITVDGYWTLDLALPEMPIMDVTEVVEISGDDETTLDTDTYVWSAAILRRLDQAFCGGFQNYRVTYDHGYAIVPDDIRAATLAVASRIYASAATSSASGGTLVEQAETIGGYSHDEKYDTGGVATVIAETGLTGAEKVSLDRYRKVTLG